MWPLYWISGHKSCWILTKSGTVDLKAKPHKSYQTDLLFFKTICPVQPIEFVGPPNRKRAHLIQSLVKWHQPPVSVSAKPLTSFPGNYGRLGGLAPSSLLAAIFENGLLIVFFKKAEKKYRLQKQRGHNVRLFKQLTRWLWCACACAWPQQSGLKLSYRKRHCSSLAPRTTFPRMQ